MNWKIKYKPAAEKDYEKFNKAQQNQIDKAVSKVSQNPLPQNEGGYGKALGHHEYNLTDFCKIKLKALGIRVVYELVRRDEIMEIIVVSVREDEEVYEIAAKRTGRV